MTIMAMMVLTPGLLIRAIFHCVLTSTLVVLVDWGLAFFVPAGVDFKGDVYAFVMFVPTGVESKGGRLIEIFWRSSL